MKCQRCNTQTSAHTVSYFNTQEICIDCRDKERKHPQFEEARAREHGEVMRGNLNFRGIGLPNDLK
jgi:hypothetical protein